MSRRLALALALTGILPAVGCTGLRPPRATPPELRVYALCTAEDGFRVALSAIRSGPGEPGCSYEFALLIADTQTGRVLYSHADRRLRDIPLQWLGKGPRLLVSRHEMADSDWPVSGVFALDTATVRWDRMAPHTGTERNAQRSPDYHEVVYELRPIISWVPLTMRPGAPDVYAAVDVARTRMIAERAYLVAVVPAERPPGYRAIVSRDQTLSAVNVPSGEEVPVLPSSVGTVGGYSASPDGAYVAGLGWKEEQTTTLLAVQRLDGVGQPTVVEIPSPVGNTAWAPRAEALACFGNGGLWVYHLKAGSLSRVGLNRWKPSACAWLPDGKRLVVASGPEVFLVDSETGERKSFLTVERHFGP